MISLLCGIKQRQKQQAKLTDTENRLVVARGGGWGTGEMGESTKATNFQL